MSDHNSVYIKPLFSYPQRALNEEDAKLLLTLMMAQRSGEIENLQKDVEQDFGYRVLMKRCEWAGFDIEPAAALFVVTQCANPAEIVLYVHAMFHASSRHEGKALTLEQFCDIFALGLPDEQAKHEAWDAQKILTGKGRATFNGLDRLEIFKASKEQPYKPEPVDGPGEFNA